jgi:hypothetical protein
LTMDVLGYDDELVVASTRQSCHCG